jgi:PTS system nitrogen regulatory IIA component
MVAGRRAYTFGAAAQAPTSHGALRVRDRSGISLRTVQGLRVTEFLQPGAVLASLAGTSKDQVLVELCTALSRSLPGTSAERLCTVFRERERVGSTGMEKGVAIPHARLPEAAAMLACFGVSRSGVDFGARDGRPCHFFFALVAPENSAGQHLKALSKVSRIFRSEPLKEAILGAPTADRIHALILEEDDRG